MYGTSHSLCSVDVNLFHPSLLGFPGGSNGKESVCNARRPRFHPWVRKIPWRREWYPLQCSCLEIPQTEEPGGTLFYLGSLLARMGPFSMLS